MGGIQIVFRSIVKKFDGSTIVICSLIFAIINFINFNKLYFLNIIVFIFITIMFVKTIFFYNKKYK